MKKKNGLDIRHLDIRDKNDKPINTFTDLQKANLDVTCDCGIDCCKGELILRDQETGLPVRLKIVDGEIIISS